jgi:NADPH:quinone reductase-like Zn-dependent oxidoreductase
VSLLNREFGYYVTATREWRNLAEPIVKENKLMSSIETQFLDLASHNAPYADIDPKTTLKGSASGKTVFLSGASQGIGQATAVAFAQAGAKAVYITARSKRGSRKRRRK